MKFLFLVTESASGLNSISTLSSSSAKKLKNSKVRDENIGEIKDLSSLVVKQMSYENILKKPCYQPLFESSRNRNQFYVTYQDKDYNVTDNILTLYFTERHDDLLVS